MSGVPAGRWLIVGEDPALLQRLHGLLGEAAIVATAVPLPPGRLENAIDGAFGEEVDVVVQVLRVAAPAASVGAWSAEAWDAGITAWLRAAFVVARRAVEEFVAQGRPGTLLYVVEATPAAAAALRILRPALLALVRSVAKEYGGKGITCNVVCAADAVSKRVVGCLQPLARPGGYVSGEWLELNEAG